MLENHRLMIRHLADDIGISKGSVNTILKNVLGLKRVKYRLVPKSLNKLEKKRRVEVCETMLSDYIDRPNALLLETRHASILTTPK